MAHIVPLPHLSTRAATQQEQTAHDPFDVVVFLEHFQHIDSFSDHLMAHFEAPTDTTSHTNTAPQQNLVLQLPEMQVAMTLGPNSL